MPEAASYDFNVFVNCPFDGRLRLEAEGGLAAVAVVRWRSEAGADVRPRRVRILVIASDVRPSRRRSPYCLRSLLNHAHVRLYASLNEALPPGQRQAPVPYAFLGRVPLRTALETLGVRPAEVDVALMNGAVADLNRLLQDGDRVSVYPRFHRLRPDVGGGRPSEAPRFLLDAHLGRLAKYLRMLGLDARYHADDPGDAALAQIVADEGRVLLSRDRDLLGRPLVWQGYFVQATDPEEQIEEVIGRFGLREHVRPLTRCLRCNGPLTSVPKAEVAEELPPQTRRHVEAFYRCTGCGRVYWEGSHYARMRRFVERLLG